MSIDANNAENFSTGMKTQDMRKKVIQNTKDRRNYEKRM
jgi:hypothetical protein